MINVTSLTAELWRHDTGDKSVEAERTRSEGLRFEAGTTSAAASELRAGGIM